MWQTVQIRAPPNSNRAASAERHHTSRKSSPEQLGVHVEILVRKDTTLWHRRHATISYRIVPGSPRALFTLRPDLACNFWDAVWSHRGGCQPPFPPAVAHRLLLTALTAAIEWPGVERALRAGASRDRVAVVWAWTVGTLKLRNSPCNLRRATYLVRNQYKFTIGSGYVLLISLTVNASCRKLRVPIGRGSWLY